MRQTLLILFVYLCFYSVNAQGVGQDEGNMKESQKYTQEVLMLTAIIINDPVQQDLFAEFERNTSYLPKAYLNVAADGFNQPKYTGDWNADVALLKKELMSWSTSQPESFLKIVEAKGLVQLNNKN